MSIKDLGLTMDAAAVAAVEQYETYVAIARLNEIPGVLPEPEQFDDGEIAPLGLTLISA